MTETLLKIEDLKLSFHTDRGVVKALDGVSLQIQKGKILGLVGETGCGKSVTANAILRLIPSPPGKIEGGKVVFKGEDLFMVSEDKIRSVRGGEIAMIFQDPFSSLNPVYDVGSQIAEAIRLHQDMEGQAALAKAADMMDAVGIPEARRRLRCYPHQFSGGMRQRVVIAMALSCNPDLLIADEPTTALDVTIQAQILDLIFRLNQEMGTSILLVSHDLGVISEMCDEVAIMYAGNIVEVAGVPRFFEERRHPYSQGLLSAIPRIREKRESLSVIPGHIPDLINPPPGCRYHPRCAWAMKRCEKEKPQLTAIAPGHGVACFRVIG